MPASIARKDLAPKLEKDPDFYEKQGIKIHKTGDGEDAGTILRQDPGPLNSLGRMKFNFQNRHAVYLHGTPHVELFGKDARALSSGCIRLKEPLELAQILLKNNPQWTTERIQENIDSVKTKTISFKDKTPIKLLYWTTVIDKKDRVNFYNDIYGLDREWEKML